MSNKLGFLAVTSLVIGSQIGTGIFTLPSSLAKYGPISIVGWLISGIGAILLALVFSYLCMKTNRSGGPHVYVEEAFGRSASFFIAWSYWLISWISSAAVVISAAGFIMHILGNKGPIFNLFLEIFILFLVSLVNIKGVGLAGNFELALTIFKCIPLIIIPVAGLLQIRFENFTPVNISDLSNFDAINKSTAFTLWGFIGLECATATAAIIEEPKKTIPKAVVFGTSIVAIIYILNSVGIMAVLEPNSLINQNAPYVKAASVLFSGNWDILFAIISAIACIGTLNAWVLTSSQIALGASKDGLFPKFFSKTNSKSSPYIGILISFFGTVPLLLLTLDQNLINQVNIVIDLSVTAFLFIYIACMASFYKLKIGSKFQRFICILALIFCIWALMSVSLVNILLSLMFIISGIPIYFMRRG